MIVFRDIRFQAEDFRGVELTPAEGGGVRFVLDIAAKYEERIEPVMRTAIIRTDKSGKAKVTRPEKDGAVRMMERVPLQTPLATTYENATLARLDAATIYRAAGRPLPDWTKPQAEDA